MKKFGLIGYPLSHSFSKKYFSEKFENENIKECRYDNYSIESIDKLPGIIENNPELIGLNVTIPYKEKVLPYLNETDDAAKQIGAVNTIRIYRDSTIKLKGFNTDYWGFYHSLKPFLNENHKNALIMGTGGASKAVAYTFKMLKMDYQYVSRSPKVEGHISYEQLTAGIFGKFQVIVNTTPSGMYPNIDSCPDIPYNFISEDYIMYDLIYNPEETIFLKKGKERGAVTINGLEMLHLQAEKAWEIWNDK